MKKEPTVCTIEDVRELPIHYKNGSIHNHNMATSLSYLLVTGRVIRDVNMDNLYTYLDIFEEVVIPKDSASTVRNFVVAGKIFTDTAGKIDLEVSVVGPGEFIKTTKLSGNVMIGVVEIASAFNLVQFENEGKYYLKIKVNNIQLEDGGRYYFNVTKEK